MSASGKLAGRTAVITGSGGEIGGAIARGFAQEGASVVIADYDEDKAQKTAQDIIGAGGAAIAYRTDVSIAADAERTAKVAVETFGKLHILVNVAATVTPDGTVVDLTLEDWNRALSVNLTGAFLMCKYAIPHIKAAGGGSIINIASQLGQMATAKRSPYCTSKAGLIHFSKALAIDHAKDNIRVNSLSPGAIETVRSLGHYGNDPEEARRRRGPLYLLGRAGHVEEVAAGALFLASDDSSFMTASDLLIDGGYLAFKPVVGR
jgi:NAD(P)-dependent dehydrogenase (short-subunit alcohol dehydrogenase family)